MWFLILEILLLLLAAFALGALAAYWWFMRRYEDVSESHEEILADLRRDARAQAKSQDHVMGELAKLTGGGVSINGNAGLRPVEERLDRMERMLAQSRVSESELRPVAQGLASLEQRLGAMRMPDVDLRPVHERLARLEQAVTSGGNMDQLRPMYERLGSLERAVTEFRIPVTDLTPVSERLMRLEGQLGALTSSDLTIVGERLEVIETHLMAQDGPDLTPLIQRLDRVENYLARAPEAKDVDLGPVHAGLLSLEQAISGIDIKDPDLTPINERMSALESALVNLKIPETNLTPVYQRLQAIEAAILGFSIPDTDLEPLHRQLRVIETKLDETDPSPADLVQKVSRVEDALSAISLSVSSLRSQPPENLDARIASIETTVKSFSSPDLYPVLERLGSIETSISNVQPQGVDYTPLNQRLNDLEGAISTVYSSVSALRPPNLQPVEDRLRRVEDMIAAIRLPDVDFGPLQGTLMRIDQSIQAVRSDVRGMPGLESLEKRLSSLQDSMMAIREPDLTPVMRTMRSIDTRLDLGAFEDRLNAIEYGLAAVHRTLRSRADVGITQYDEVVTRTMPPPPAQAARVDVNGSLSQSRRPSPDADPINSARRPNDRANLLMTAAFGEADDLEQINGVGPMLNELLNDIGVFYFWQIAEWTPQEVDWVDDQLLHFKGRIARDNWVDQARELARQSGAAPRPS